MRNVSTDQVNLGVHGIVMTRTKGEALVKNASTDQVNLGVRGIVMTKTKVEALMRNVKKYKIRI
jgi:hypothetical protein